MKKLLLTIAFVLVLVASSGYGQNNCVLKLHDRSGKSLIMIVRIDKIQMVSTKSTRVRIHTSAGSYDFNLPSKKLAQQKVKDLLVRIKKCWKY